MKINSLYKCVEYKISYIIIDAIFSLIFGTIYLFINLSIFKSRLSPSGVLIFISIIGILYFILLLFYFKSFFKYKEIDYYLDNNSLVIIRKNKIIKKIYYDSIKEVNIFYPTATNGVISYKFRYINIITHSDKFYQFSGKTEFSLLFRKKDAEEFIKWFDSNISHIKEQQNLPI